MFIYRYTLQGLGDSKIPTLAGMMELVMRVSAAMILTHWIGFYGIAFSSPLAWLGAIVPLVTTYRKRKREFKAMALSSESSYKDSE